MRGRLDAAVGAAVEEGATRLLERHLEQSREWFPHELIPWELGRRCGPGEAVPPAEGSLPPGACSALFVNVLTEDNLPHYFAAITATFPSDGALAEWSRRWAAEEQRHGIALRDWVSVTRHLDLVHLERARMRQLSVGFAPGVRGRGLVDALVYLAMQELATRISHWNTGRFLDPIGATVMKRIAADENRHHLFYRDLVGVALQVDPSTTVCAIDRQVTAFEMPGTLIEDFQRHAQAIAAAGIYDLRVHHDQVLQPLISGQWRVAELDGLDEEAEAARRHLLTRLGRLRRVAERLEADRLQGEREGAAPCPGARAAAAALSSP